MRALATDAGLPGRQPLQAASPPRGARPQDAGDQAILFSQAKAAHDRARSLIKQSQELVALAQTLTRERAQRRHALVCGQPSRPQRTSLQESAYLRLLARLETMPVIEQAKGILMAQSRCTDAEAFDLLRRASQRSNVPVRELAARLVATTVQAAPDMRKAG